ncbi:MAG: CDC48 family AAA ATPase [Euryarchaeota archaeon]|nr:CDC48 family AAA ATPase [Euryarchaeota archaeon]
MAGSIVLRVAPTNQQEDVGAGRARIDTAGRLALGVSPGDVVEIRGRRTTCAVVWRMVQAQDENKATLRIDGLTRKNAGLSVGDQAVVARAEPKVARKLTLAPVLEGKNKIKFGPGFEAVARRGLLNRPLAKEDLVFIPGMALMGGTIPFLVSSTYPAGIVLVGDGTELAILETAAAEPGAAVAAVSYEDVGGLKEELRRVREMIELPLKHPELFERLGIDPPKGVLLHGPPGTGKTMIARAVANESGARFFSIQGPEIMDKYYGASEEHLRKRFEEAQKASPSVLFIDELDSIAPRRGDVHGEVERRVVAQMLTLMDGLSGRGKLIVIAATNRVDAIDPALRRPGRFDREIEIGVPDRGGRLEILQVHTRGMPLGPGVELERLADVTHGFVGADLAALCKEAAMRCVRRVLPEFFLDKPLPAEELERIRVTAEDFRGALKEIEPSALRDLLTEIPAVRWDDVGGLEQVKSRLKEMVEWPLNRPDSFRRLGVQGPKGILLFGPPGTGKTLLAKAVATESSANFISIKGPEVFSKWVGESEKAIREIFKKARQSSPSIVFLDELDALAPRRGAVGDSGASERVVNQLLTSLDGLERLEQVVVLAATNRPDMIDPALLRPGRFDHLVLVPAPDPKARLAILRVHTSAVPLEGVDLEALAGRLEGYVGADIEALVREAALSAMRENPEASKVRPGHFEAALPAVRPSADGKTMKYYADLERELSGGLRRVRDDVAGYR